MKNSCPDHNLYIYILTYIGMHIHADVFSLYSMCTYLISVSAYMLVISIYKVYNFFPYSQITPMLYKLFQRIKKQMYPIKYLRINLTRAVKDPYSENYTRLKKELRKTQINGSIYHVHGVEELNHQNGHTAQSNL